MATVARRTQKEGGGCFLASICKRLWRISPGFIFQRGTKRVLRRSGSSLAMGDRRRRIGGVCFSVSASSSTSPAWLLRFGSAPVRAFFLRPPNGLVDSIVFRFDFVRSLFDFFRLAAGEDGVSGIPEKGLLAMVKRRTRRKVGASSLHLARGCGQSLLSPRLVERDGGRNWRKQRD
ncbi:uncharacterized protein LOC115687901 isoform X2 [Syzygium oleosum]|uniref:uncharacterized protein LOC115687901 isoform X2 n=1 Tax=Syzygium oleosum TaxID=219896 RepID=UPI0024BB74B6|nr:uncharacterized protein LOC115687901 isoform X2 [Syzygium oleosum]